MKKLNTNSVGRMPLWQADLNWMQSAYTEPLTALIGELGLSKEYFVITGCVPYKPNAKTLAMPAGWFWWNGQILPVRALPATDALSFTNPVVQLTRVANVNPDGARSFIHADLSTETIGNVWQDDYLAPAVVERSAGFTGGVRLGVGAWTLRDILMHHTAENESEWMNGHSGNLQFKRLGQMVVLKGTASVSDSSQPIDEGFPPPLAGMAMLHPLHLGDINVYFNEQGQLVCHGTGQTLPLSVTLTGMTYMAATPYQASDPNTINDNPHH